MVGFLILVLILGLLILLVASAHGVGQLVAIWGGAPYVASGKEATEDMITLAEITPSTRLLELGSGDGALCLAAATRGARAHGIEINPVLVLLSWLRARLRRLHDRATFSCENIWSTPFPRETNVVCLYLLPKTLPRVWEKLCRDLEPGTVVISHGFPFPSQTVEAKRGNVYRYRLPVSPQTSP